MSRAGDSPSTRPLQSATYLFSVGSAAVLGSSNVSTQKALEICQVSPALRPAAPEDGRTPLNRYSATRRPDCGEHSWEEAVPLGSNLCSQALGRVAGRHRRVACATKNRFLRSMISGIRPRLWRLRLFLGAFDLGRCTRPGVWTFMSPNSMNRLTDGN